MQTLENGGNRKFLHEQLEDLRESHYQAKKTIKEGTEAVKDVAMQQMVKDWVAQRKVVLT